MVRTLTLRNVPEPALRALRRRARRNGRSLQGELLSIVRQATLDARSFDTQIEEFRASARGRMTLDEIHEAIAGGRP